MGEEMPSFERNEAVEVYCASQRQWVASTVLDILPHRSVHVDCGAFEKLIPLSQCTSCTIRKKAAAHGETAPPGFSNSLQDLRLKARQVLLQAAASGELQRQLQSKATASSPVAECL